MATNEVPSAMVSAISVAASSTFSTMTAFAVENRVAERAPRVSRKVWEEKSCSQLGGELDWLPREVKLLRRNCFKEARRSS
jgi:hypothetical protein